MDGRCRARWNRLRYYDARERLDRGGGLGIGLGDQPGPFNPKQVAVTPMSTKENSASLTPVEQQILEGHLEDLRNLSFYMKHEPLDVTGLQDAIERTTAAVVDALRILLGRER